MRLIAKQGVRRHVSNVLYVATRGYDIIILNHINFNFLNENFVNLFMKNESDFFTIYIYKTTYKYLNKYI